MKIFYKIVLKIVVVVLLGYLLFSMRWLNTPDYEQGFVRNSLTIDEGLNIIEVAVVNLSEQEKQSLKPKKGYFLRVFDGYPSSDFINRFKKYAIPRIRRGYVKHWASEKSRAQIDITKMLEVNNQEAIVFGVIRYPGNIIKAFECTVTQDMNSWVVTKGQYLDRSKYGK
jgi:hypothetical protein